MAFTLLVNIVRAQNLPLPPTGVFIPLVYGYLPGEDVNSNMMVHTSAKMGANPTWTPPTPPDLIGEGTLYWTNVYPMPATITLYVKRHTSTGAAKWCYAVIDPSQGSQSDVALTNYVGLPETGTIDYTVETAASFAPPPDERKLNIPAGVEVPNE